jgi:hypothetical protein
MVSQVPSEENGISKSSVIGLNMLPSWFGVEYGDVLISYKYEFVFTSITFIPANWPTKIKFFVSEYDIV